MLILRINFKLFSNYTRNLFSHKLYYLNFFLSSRILICLSVSCTNHYVILWATLIHIVFTQNYMLYIWILCDYLSMYIKWIDSKLTCFSANMKWLDSMLTLLFFILLLYFYLLYIILLCDSWDPASSKFSLKDLTLSCEGQKIKY